VLLKPGWALDEAIVDGLGVPSGPAPGREKQAATSQIALRDLGTEVAALGGVGALVIPGACSLRLGLARKARPSSL